MLTSAAHSRLKPPPIHYITIAQFAVAIISAMVMWSSSWVHSYSALLGGLICCIPNAFFIYRSFAHQGARAARLIVNSFYKAEAVKLGLTALLFAAVFKFVHPLEPLTLLVAFFVVQSVHWLAPILLVFRK